jgi:Fic family protein
MNPDLSGSPYSVEPAAAVAIQVTLARLEDRCALLRSSGHLTAATLQAYYDARKFRQVTESNALEGSTLSLGETELAILQGVTITGHDPAYARDARSLFKAVEHIAELARSPEPVGTLTVKALHALILEGQPGAGLFRTHPVRIRGHAHRPPATITQLLDAMEQWHHWSEQKHAASPLLRACVLHTWLAHIHPFSDGNGRTARAVANLELIRAGLPPVIIRKKDRARYLNALQISDVAGDLTAIFSLFHDRINHALHDLEQAARRAEAYDPAQEKLRQIQQQSLDIWNAAAALLIERLRQALVARIEPAGTVTHRWLERSLDLDAFVAPGEAWLCTFEISGPQSASKLLLAAVHPSETPLASGTDPNGPALVWCKATGAYPPWQRLGADAPGAAQAVLEGDQWVFFPRAGKRWTSKSPSAAAALIADDIVAGLDLQRRR